MSFLDGFYDEQKLRGYEIYTEEKVLSFSLEELSQSRFKAMVMGTSCLGIYDTVIDLAKTDNSFCDCPHFERTGKKCKHMAAVYFAFFPEEAEEFINEYIGEKEG